MKKLIATEELIQQFSNPDFVLKTQQQIHKDFSSYGAEINDVLLDRQLDRDAITAIISEALVRVFHSGESKLLQLSYQIDLPQEQFLEAVAGQNPMKDLSDLILRREAFKVYFRTMF